MMHISALAMENSQHGLLANFLFTCSCYFAATSESQNPDINPYLSQ